MLAKPPQQGWVGLEKELIEVSIRPFARTQHEIAFEVGGGDQVARQLIALVYQGLPATPSI
jgi:hypothetical protein